MPLRRLDKLVTYLVVGPFAIVLAFPFYWMLQTSLKSEIDLYNVENVPFAFGEGSPTLDNYSFLFSDTQYARWLLNTVLVGLAVVVIALAVAMPAGYALARLSGRWGQTMGVGIFLVYLVPPTLLFLPLSRVIAELGLQDRLGSLILVYPGFTIPISVPGILTVVIFSFSLVMNEFVYAVSFITASTSKTVSTGIYTELIRGDVFYWGALMAATLIPSIPLALLYNTFLDRFIAGFTGGAFR